MILSQQPWNIGAISVRRRKLSDPRVQYMVCGLRATRHARGVGHITSSLGSTTMRQPFSTDESDWLARTHCTATTIFHLPTQCHGPHDFKSVLLWSDRKVARGDTDWSRCRSCACDVTASGVSLEHVQTTTRTPDTLRKWIGCKLLLAGHQRRTQPQTLRQQISRVPLAGLRELAVRWT